MKRSWVPAFASVLFTGFSLVSESQLQTCHVQVTLSNAEMLPPTLKLQIYQQNRRVAEATVPWNGSITLPPLAAGDYRAQTGGMGKNFLVSKPVHVPPAGPCEMGINIFGRADAKNKLVDDDLELEDLRVSSKARAAFRQAFADFQRGELEKARSGFLRVVQLAPRLSRAYNVLGVISDQLGDRKAGRQYFEKSLELNPRSKTTLMNLAKLLMLEKQFDAALELLERYRQGSPEIAEVHAMEADAYLNLGKYKEAIREASAAHNLPHVNWEMVHTIAARAYEALQQPELAAQEYRRYGEETSNPAMKAFVGQRIRDLSGELDREKATVEGNSFAPR